jgi:hypothetical protein
MHSIFYFGHSSQVFIAQKYYEFASFFLDFIIVHALSYHNASRSLKNSYKSLFNKCLYQTAKSEYQNDNAKIKEVSRSRVLPVNQFCRF